MGKDNIYKLIFDNAVMGIYFSTIDGKHTHVNKTLTEIYGYTSEKELIELINNIGSELYVDTGQRKKFITTLLENNECLNFESQIYRKDNHIVWISESAKLIQKDDKTPYIVGTVKDISKEKRLKQENDLKLQQIIQQDKLRFLGEMVAGIAHEINNPNNYIGFNIALLEDNWKIFEPILKGYISENDVSEDLNEMIDEMSDIFASLRTGKEKIEETVSNLKNFSRDDSEKPVEDININNSIRKALKLLKVKLKNSGSGVDLFLYEQIPSFKGFPNRIEQIVINLVSNAIDAVRGAEDKLIKISTMCRSKPDAVVFIVEDRGCGIANTNIERILEPFFTTNQSIGGTGLGLPVSYEILLQHNARLIISSKEGERTRFVCLFPLDGKEISIDDIPTLKIEYDRTYP